MTNTHGTAIEVLRHMVDVFGDCNESFLDRFTRDQLVRLYDAWMASEWDIAPDRWSEAQVQDAIRYGIEPSFSSDETPVTYEQFQ